VYNTNILLGHDGFVGVKTGSTGAAGGCFAFRAIRWIDGKRTTITGVVMGQPGDDLGEAGLAALPPWSTASPVIGVRQIQGSEPCHHSLCPEAHDHARVSMCRRPWTRSKDVSVTSAPGHRDGVNPVNTRERRYE